MTKYALKMVLQIVTSKPNPKPWMKKRKAISYIFLTNTRAMAVTEKKTAPMIPINLAEYLFNNVLVSRPIQTNILEIYYIYLLYNTFIIQSNTFIINI